MTNKFSPYRPPYTFNEKLRRYGAILRAFAGGAKITVLSKLRHQSQTAFGASVEVTDRCNAGCHYCYVYPPEWDQKQRIEGYLQLAAEAHREKEQQVFETLEKLKNKGIVLVTLVGGEPALAPKALQRASELFPIVWIVTNGVAKLPNLPRSVAVGVSIDGPPECHNRSRDPLGFFANHRYGELTGMSAAIVRNINQSERGAFAHITVTKETVGKFPETVDWLVRDVKKLRGILVSGAATKDKADPLTLQMQDRQALKKMIEAAASQYGSELFPFNSPRVNALLFDEEHLIRTPAQCTVARRVESLDFSGKKVGKCILRDEMVCETCVCNITGLMRAFSRFDMPTILGVVRASFG